MKKTVLTLSFLLATPFAFAHTALLSCFDEGDETITCEGGFSDGSSVAGMNFYVEQGGQKVLEEKFDELNSVNFKKPDGDFSVMLDAGEGHQVKINGKDIN